MIPTKARGGADLPGGSGTRSGGRKGGDSGRGGGGKSAGGKIGGGGRSGSARGVEVGAKAAQTSSWMYAGMGVAALPAGDSDAIIADRARIAAHHAAWQRSSARAAPPAATPPAGTPPAAAATNPAAYRAAAAARASAAAAPSAVTPKAQAELLARAAAAASAASAVNTSPHVPPHEYALPTELLAAGAAARAKYSGAFGERTVHGVCAMSSAEEAAEALNGRGFTRPTIASETRSQPAQVDAPRGSYGLRGPPSCLGRTSSKAAQPIATPPAATPPAAEYVGIAEARIVWEDDESDHERNGRLVPTCRM